MSAFTFLAAVLVIAGVSLRVQGASTGSTYTLTDDMSYKNFFQSFDLFSGPDPTSGFVQYQNFTSAIDQQMIGYYEDTKSVFMGVDSTTKDPKGRASIRAEGTKTWNQGLLIADIAHMPESVCGSWPAFWMLGVGANGSTQWPQAGEIDILEGVNDQTANAVTLHTAAGCAVENSTLPAMGQSSTSSTDTAFSGTMSTDDCDVNAAGQPKNVGCSIQAPPLSHPQGLPTYGSDFNKAGGGVYAMEWTSSAITVWFIPRNSSTYASLFAGSNNRSISSSKATTASTSSFSSGFQYPSKSNSTHPTPNNNSSSSSNNNDGSNSTPSTSTISTSDFPTPLAKFQGPDCSFDTRFSHLKVIFNTAFCGDWAGKVWDDSCKAKTGVATCEEYVRDHPEAFADSYWEIRGLKWYEDAGKNGTAAAGAKVVVPRHDGKGVHARGRRYAW